MNEAKETQTLNLERESGETEEPRRAKEAASEREGALEALSALSLQHERDFSEDLLKKWTDGYLEMKRVFDDERVEELCNEYFSHYRKPEHLGFIFLNFKTEGAAVARKLFGDERVRRAIEIGRTDICSFGEDEWRELIEVLGDKPPYDHTWNAVWEGGMCARSWIEGTHKIEERKQWMTQEEFGIVLENRNVRQILVEDSRPSIWPLYYRQEELMEGADPDEAARETHEVITEERWNEWKTFWGGRWADFLKCNPPGELVQDFSPKDLEKLESIVPGMVKKVRTGPPSQSVLWNIKNILDLPLERFFVLDSYLDKSLGDKRESFLRGRTPGEICYFLTWLDTDYSNRETWEKVKDMLPDEYIEKVLNEERLVFENWSNTAHGHSGEGEIQGISKETFETISLEAFKQRHEADSLVESDEYLRKIVADVPESAPFLRLRYADAVDNNMSREDTLNHMKSFAGKVERVSIETPDASLTPSMGAEIEVMKDTPIKQENVKKYVASAIFGLPRSIDEKWEMQTEPHSARMTNRFIAELINQGLVDRKWLSGNRYSLHLNVGIPEGTTPVEQEVDHMAYALMSAHGNEERLSKGAWGASFFIKSEEGGRGHYIKKQVKGKKAPYGGRIELRAHALDRESLYKLLYDAEALSTALWAYEKKESERTAKEKQLARIALEFYEKTLPLFGREGIHWRGKEGRRPIADREELAQKLLSLKSDMKREVKQAVGKIRRVLRDPK